MRLSVRNAGAGSACWDVSLTVREGEISGLPACWLRRTETANLIFGAERLQRGEIRYDGEARSYRQPADAIADGIGLVAEDRKVDGIISRYEYSRNMTLALLPKLARAGIVDAPARMKSSFATSRRWASNAPLPTSLSGLSPWQSAEGPARPMALYRSQAADRRRADPASISAPIGNPPPPAPASPTRARRAMISSELEELLAAADRVTVLSDGTSVAVCRQGIERGCALCRHGTIRWSSMTTIEHSDEAPSPPA